ncbi:MAG TPA: hypothetical protein VMV46_21455 [Thermoanaerobaculia bacterium]|nr:hypothetical protein [Thermoanaerobaculia bacterium]
MPRHPTLPRSRRLAAAVPHRASSAYRRPDPLVVMLVTVALIVTLALIAPRAEAFELRFTTENDLLVTDQDDLYTFAVALELHRGPYTVSFRENAFTDRAAGLRFDESQLALGRALPAPEPWSLHAEAGLVHVGEGLFGEQTQNRVHDLIGGEQVDLPYVESSLHGRLALTAQRSFALTDRLGLGPRLELDAIPGLRSHAVLAAHADWRPHRALALHAVVGARFSDASHAALERHLQPSSAVVRVVVQLRETISLTWTYNDYGDGREHLTVGYRVPSVRLLPSGGTTAARTCRAGCRAATG